MDSFRFIKLSNRPTSISALRQSSSESPTRLEANMSPHQVAEVISGELVESIKKQIRHR